MSSEWEKGFAAGYTAGIRAGTGNIHHSGEPPTFSDRLKFETGRKSKRKLSAWQKFVKVNSKKPRFRYKSGANKGKINLKALGVAYRKKMKVKRR